MAALSRANLMLIPGLVGLAVVDSFAAQCPVVTTDFRGHSPEFEYIEWDKWPGITGIEQSGRVREGDQQRTNPTE